MARGNPDGSARRATIPSPVTRHSSLSALNHQLSTHDSLLASPESVGRSGGGLDFDSSGGFFHVRPVATNRGKIRAAGAGGDGGIEKAAAFVCRTGGRARALGRRPAKTVRSKTARRVRGAFEDVNRPQIRAHFR